MSYVANCLKKLFEKDETFFKPNELDVLDCVSYVMVQSEDVNGEVLTDSNGNQVLLQVQVITNTIKYIWLVTIFEKICMCVSVTTTVVHPFLIILPIMIPPNIMMKLTLIWLV